MKSSRWLAGIRDMWKNLSWIILSILRYQYRTRHGTLVRDALDSLREELLKYRLPEEKAWELAHEAGKSAEMCGCCRQELPTREPAYSGTEIYVGMQYLLRNRGRKPRIFEPRYEHTVLCGSCGRSDYHLRGMA